MSEREAVNTCDMDQTPVLLFDGVCNLCNAGVRWIVKRDRRRVFRFASLQSEAAVRLLAQAGVTGQPPDSMILIDEAGVHYRSDAAIGVAARLGFPWTLARTARIVPRGLRDAVYGWIARNRYRWFGKRDSCLVPTEELKGRFVADVEDSTG